MKYAAVCLCIGISLLSWCIINAQTPTFVPPESTPSDIPTVELVIPTLNAITPTEPTLDIPTTPTETATVEEPTIIFNTTDTMLPSETTTIQPSATNTDPPTSSASPVPTETPTLNVIHVTGQVMYPNHVSGNAQIQIQAFGAEGNLLNSTYTDTQGYYTLTIPADQITRVEMKAHLYLPEVVYVVPGVMPVPIVLRAGDLDGDACVGNKDVGILTSNYGQLFTGADLDGSGWVDAVDLALLSANYDPSCGLAPITETPTATAEIATPENIVTETPSPTSTMSKPATPTLTETASMTPVVEYSPEQAPGLTSSAPVDNP